MARVLIVDDAAFMRTILKNILTEGGHTVVGEAENGVAALDRYKELRPDIVTLDITMPEVDGIEALKRIKAYDSNATCIMCSAMGQQAMVLDSVKNGAKDFIVKPFQADKILASINKLV